MFKKLLSRLFGKSQQRIEAEEAYEEDFGRPPPRSFSTSYLRQLVEDNRKPMAVRRVNSGHGVRSAVADSRRAASHPCQPIHPVSPAWSEAPTSRSHSSCYSHHSSSSYDSGSSDSGSGGSCD